VPRELLLAEIFQLGYYWETKILLTAVKLDVFSVVAGKARTASEIAERIGAHTPSLELLLNALVAIGLLRKDIDCYLNAEVADKHLVRSESQYVGHLLLLHEAEWMNWGHLEETIRTGRPPVRRHIFESNPELGANVLQVLDRIGQQSGPSLAKAFELGWATRFLDLGGGAATNAIAFCKAYPKLRATVFDLPQTLTTASRTIKDAGMESRIQLLGGDFNVDSLGGPYDVVLMSDILHYQSAEDNAALVNKVFTHLTDGGQLIIKDRFLHATRTSPAWVTAFAVHILVNTERGRCYTTAEAMAWMSAAHFESVVEMEPSAVVRGTKART
jgi:predicted O-methyltransferase YrrM